MKRSTAGLIAVAGATTMLLAACSSSDSETTDTATSATGACQGKTIAFVMGAVADPFFNAMKVGAQEEATAQGATLVWQGDKEYSPATQIPVLDQVLATNPAGLVLIPTDPTALQAGNDKAIAAGIPVVNVDTRVGDISKTVAFITGDNTDGGSKAADAIATAIGYEDGKSYKVVVGLTSKTATTNVARLEGFQAALKANYPGIKVVDVAYSESNSAKANTNVNNWLTKYPDLNGIFAIDGTNGTGAAAALQAKGLTGKVALVGYDAYPDNVKLIKDGVFTALIAQDPGAEAKLAIQNICTTIGGGTVTEREVVIPNVVLDANTTEADLKKYTYVA
ncbi:MAG: substrate-binding domain-containing protein [Candidatus Nanopelagicales bacterium]|nr:substrate-binding domain-containing protein [Candidatus Nanopelagicales bacterium]MDD2819118.1 substrate-binding domain-containing protein [Candidatus Nanopelagicales bacterium]